MDFSLDFQDKISKVEDRRNVLKVLSQSKIVGDSDMFKDGDKKDTKNLDLAIIKTSNVNSEQELNEDLQTDLILNSDRNEHNI